MNSGTSSPSSRDGARSRADSTVTGAGSRRPRRGLAQPRWRARRARSGAMSGEWTRCTSPSSRSAFARSELLISRRFPTTSRPSERTPSAVARASSSRPRARSSALGAGRGGGLRAPRSGSARRSPRRGRRSRGPRWSRRSSPPRPRRAPRRAGARPRSAPGARPRRPPPRRRAPGCRRRAAPRRSGP